MKLASVGSYDEFKYINSFMTMTSDYYWLDYQKPNGTTQWKWRNGELFQPEWCERVNGAQHSLIGHFYGTVYRPKMCMDYSYGSSYNFVCEKENDLQSTVF